MAVRTGTSLLRAVRLELGDRNCSDNNNNISSNSNSNSNNDKKKKGFPRGKGKTPKNGSPPLLSFSKPSWVVRTESNVCKETRKKPDPPCMVCKGTGRVDCHHCSGRGRTNYVHLAMLPKGEWPKWCRTCGGSGLGYCSRCLGTGEYRYIMGFQFMKPDFNTQGQQEHQSQGDSGPHSAADQLLNGEHLNSIHDIQRFGK